MIPWLEADSPFPPLDTALTEPNGLLAAGGQLSPRHLIAAYRRGIFPWFSPGDPILWWSPDPRMVLFPPEFRLSRSLRKRLRRGDFTITFDRSFVSVMQACATTPRDGQNGTWINDEMIAAYSQLHELGYAHSVEAWSGQAFEKADEAVDAGNHPAQLVGGLYGIAIGRMFYGESMFSHATDASKAAFAHLVRFLATKEYEMIDCQMNTAHLASLGAREVSRARFIDRLAALTARENLVWPSGRIEYPW